MRVVYILIYLMMSVQSCKNVEDISNIQLPCFSTNSPEENVQHILGGNIPIQADSPTQCTQESQQYIDNFILSDSKNDFNNILKDCELGVENEEDYAFCDLQSTIQEIFKPDVDASTLWLFDSSNSLPSLFNETFTTSIDIESDTEDAYENKPLVELDDNKIYDECEVKDEYITIKKTKIEENQEFITKRALAQDCDGDTLFHILLSKEEKEDNTDRCLFCIPGCIPGKKGLDAINNMGQTALHIACYTENTDVTKALLEHGAEPSLLDRDGNTCLHIACELISTPLVKCIVSTLENMNGKTVKNLLKLTNSKGYAAIHIATLKADIDLLQILYDYGANVDQQDDCCKKTPLMFACENGHVKTAKFLLERLYADVNIRTPSDYSALHIASEIDSLELVECLLTNGADIGNKTAYLKTEKDLTSSEKVKVFLERHLRKLRRRKSHEKPLWSDIH